MDIHDSTRNAPPAHSTAAGAAPAPVPPRTTPSEADVTLGARIGGVLFLANALITILDRIEAQSEGGSFGGVAPIIIDVIIGLSLVKGDLKYRTWAIVRVIIGAIVFGGIQFANQDWLLAALQLAVSGSFLLLLIGTPGKARIAAGCTMYGAYVLLILIGLLM
jgi:hypothetical protein